MHAIVDIRIKIRGDRNRGKTGVEREEKEIEKRQRRDREEERCSLVQGSEAAVRCL